MARCSLGRDNSRSPQQIRNGCRNSGGLLPDAAPGGRAKSGQLLRGYCGVSGASVKTAPPGKTRLPCRLSCCVSSCGEEMEVWTEAEVQMPSTRQQPDNRRSAANGTNSLTIMTRSHFSEGDASCFSLRPSGNRSPITRSAVRVSSSSRLRFVRAVFRQARQRLPVRKR
jgi:hypothetical protein